MAAIGAGVGIGLLASSALEGAARQPEAYNDLRSMMILASALIEGAVFFAMIISVLVIFFG